ncbi:hypothetical protein BKA62DRAFT_833519 [Auriculariales sp. MPI-PUGE-AT-0066]|nr:hypothetical protein BKA62DRAFT_833519 [Auriculariales sp. MPI-PUGE-AT-0066]
MRAFTTVALASIIAAAQAADITCSNAVSDGILNIYKNSLTGQMIPLTFDASGGLVSGTSQNIVEIVGCTSTYIGKPATTVSADKRTITVNGKVRSGSNCLSRVPSDGHLALVACVDTDNSAQDNQFWSIDLVYHEGDQATGSDETLKFVKSGYYNHYTGGKVYESNSQPPSTWLLTFSYVE